MSHWHQAQGKKKKIKEIIIAALMILLARKLIELVPL
jgi:hypothetical protein